MLNAVSYVLCVTNNYVFIFQIRLIIYWVLVALLSFAVVIWKSSYNDKSKDPPGTPNIIIRKVFHILAVAIFIPGILYDPALLHVCSAVATSLFLFVEVRWVHRVDCEGGWTPRMAGNSEYIYSLITIFITNKCYRCFNTLIAC